MTRTEILTRYLELRDSSKYLHNAALKFVAPATFIEHARRLGLMVGRTLVAESEAEMTLANDLAVYTAKEGRSTALDRYARTHPPAPGSDEALVLNATRHARFSIWRIERRHEAAGLIVLDLLRDQEAWLVDRNLEANAVDGMAIAARLYEPESFAMTSGVIVPTLPKVMERVMHDAEAWRHETREQIARDPRFAVAVYRAAIASGLMANVAFAPPGAAESGADHEDPVDDRG
ncbi:hypothetical protein [Rhodopila globiformis]|uniref:hypothetical protein n=1 Tax=Rhodopila globiformis TaxID=1071 RepID=UPI0018763231|nr:hypothetical protein [Rhodopila globiformis]